MPLPPPGAAAAEPKQADTAQDDDEGEWQEMPVVRSAVSQMPTSLFASLDDDELRRYKYRPPSPTSAAGRGDGLIISPTAEGMPGSDPSSAASGRRDKRNSRTGNATGRNLDIDDARGFNWRVKPAGVGDDGRPSDSSPSKNDSGQAGDDDHDDADDDDDDGGAAKGYTQLRIDEDQEAEEMHAATSYLFGAADVIAPGQQEFPAVTPLSQLATTKQLLTEQQKIAYVGLCSLATREMVRLLERVPGKEPGVLAARQSANEWRTKVMGSLFQHMDIDVTEQNMIESLAEHGVLVEDLAPSLITTHTVENPDYDPEAAEERAEEEEREAAAKAAAAESDAPQKGAVGEVVQSKAPATADLPTQDKVAKADADADASNTSDIPSKASHSPPSAPESNPRPSTSDSTSRTSSTEVDRPLPDAPIVEEDPPEGDLALVESPAPEPSAAKRVSTSGGTDADDGDITSLQEEEGDLAVPAKAKADTVKDIGMSSPPPTKMGKQITSTVPDDEGDLALAAPDNAGDETPRPTSPAEEKKAPVLLDPNSAGQLDAQLSTVRPSVGPALGLTAEPIPIEPPPAALEGVTTSLSTADKDITLDIRWTVLCDLFLVLTADSVYDARSRVLLERVAGALALTWMDVTQFEKRITDALEIEEGVEKLRNRRVIAEREKLARKKRYVMMGLATVGGGLVIGLSAGLLAPVIGAGLGAALGAVGIGGTTTFLGGVGGAAIITTAGTLGGAGIAGKGMSRRTRSVKTFEFKAIHNNKRVNCIVGMPGFMSGQQDDVRLPFSVLDSIMGDVFSVLWEPDMMQEMGNSLSILWNETLTQGVQQLLALTVAGGLVGALTWPMWLLKLGYLIDNPWSNALDRAKAAGLILADVLAKRQLGVRPITLVGFSLGARAIFYALVELARIKAFGVVQNVYIMGTPVTASDAVWKEARSVVAGRFVNIFSRSDWILGYLYRATSGGLRSIAGLHPVDHVPDIENVDVTHIIPGHLAYRALMPLVLSELQFRTTADYFDEPVDLNAIPIRSVVQAEEEAAAAAEAGQSGGLTTIFKRSNSTSGSTSGAPTVRPPPSGGAGQGDKKALPAKPSIEEYDEDLPERMEHPTETSNESLSSQGASGAARQPDTTPVTPSVHSPPYRDSSEAAGTPTTLGMPSPHFDPEAILAELRESGIQVRELESSLPPLVATPTSGDDSFARPAVPSKSSTLQVHSAPSPVHDRSRANSFAAPPSPSLSATASPYGAATFGPGSTGSIADFSTGAAGLPSSPNGRRVSSVSVAQQEDFGTARDRGLGRQLPSLSAVSISSAGPTSTSHIAPMPPSLPKNKSAITMGFHPFDTSVWGDPSPEINGGKNFSNPPASAPAASMMSLDALGPPPGTREPVLTFGGEDGEVSLGSPTARKHPASAPWNADNPWN